MGLASLLLIGALSSPALSAPLNSLWYDAGFYGAYLGQDFNSFPLVPPAVNYLNKDNCDPGYTFLTPQGDSVTSPGPLILDAEGDLVWMSDEYGVASDLRVQTYFGKQYLTFWAGHSGNILSNGSYHMLDSTYNTFRTINPIGDLEGDLYEFNIVGDSALIVIHQSIPADLTTSGGSEDGLIYDGMFQDIDIATGELNFQWRSSDHFNLTDSFNSLDQEDTPFDFFRITSVDKDTEGNYYVSSRNTHTVTCVSSTGHTKWILGGKRNQFTDVSSTGATNFSWQNHVRWYSGGVVTLFDNGASDGHTETTKYSRGLKLQLDEDNLTVDILQEYISPSQTVSSSDGSLQTLKSGNVFVDWGFNAGFTEFSEDGQVVCDGHFGALAEYGEGHIRSRRGFKGNWIGKPRQLPDVSISSGETPEVFVSWNGATEVTYWRLETADEITLDDDLFAETVTVRKSGFETAIEIPKEMAKYLRLVALDENNHTLTKSDLLDVNTGTSAWRAWSSIQDDNMPIIQYLITACVLCSVAAIAVWASKRWGPDLDLDENEAGVEQVKREWWKESGVENIRLPPPPPQRLTHTRIPSRYVKYRQDEKKLTEDAKAASPLPSVNPIHSGTPSRCVNYSQDEEQVNADTKAATPPTPVRFKHGTQSRYLRFKKQDN